MQTDEIGSHSVVTEGNSLLAALISLGYSDSVDRQSQNHLVARNDVHLNLGDAMNNFSCGEMENRVVIDNSDEFSSTQLGKNAKDFSLYAQISSLQGSDRIVESIPLPSASINSFAAEKYSSIENQEKLTTSGHLACPFVYTKSGVARNSLDVVRTSFETMLHNYEDLRFDTSSKKELNNFITPPELVGKVVGRNGVLTVQQTGSCLPNEWLMIEQTGLNSNNTGSSRFSNKLSLSLATAQPPVLLEQCSEMSSSGVTSYSLPDRHLVSEYTPCSSNSCKSLELPPLLSGSKFLQAMQEILAEIARYALENIKDGVNVSFSSSCIARRGNMAIDSSDFVDWDHTLMLPNKLLLQKRDSEAKKKHLLAFLQLVDDRYSQCLDEIHTVTSAFYAVTELDPNQHARFALPTISCMYKSLRERISSHILAVGAHLNEEEAWEDEAPEFCFIQKQWALQQLSKRDHQLWRPQRGLPEKSVNVLRAWMFQNFLHPYPKDAEKHLLALKSGLTRNQVSNWFINARVRLWKPMIEEMCTEMNRRKVCRNDEEMDGSRGTALRYEARRLTVD